MTTWRPSRPDEGPRPVSEALDRITGQMGVAPPSVLSAIFGRWSEIVGPEIAAKARPVSLRDGVLSLSVEHPAWGAQLRFMTGDICSRVQDFAGPGTVSEVVIRVSGERARRPRLPGS
jgi:predicted nucleic acid-binding Zn ribbon protein